MELKGYSYFKSNILIIKIHTSAAWLLFLNCNVLWYNHTDQKHISKNCNLAILVRMWLYQFCFLTRRFWFSVTPSCLWSQQVLPKGFRFFFIPSQFFNLITTLYFQSYLLYRIFWFSVMHQQESSVGTPMSAPSRTFLPYSSVQFSRSVMSDSLRPHEPQHARPPCPSPTARGHQQHVHRVDDAIQPSHPLSSLSPPALNLSQNQGLFKWISSLHQVAKVLGFQLQHQSFQ